MMDRRTFLQIFGLAVADIVVAKSTTVTRPPGEQEIVEEFFPLVRDVPDIHINAGSWTFAFGTTLQPGKRHHLFVKLPSRSRIVGLSTPNHVGKAFLHRIADPSILCSPGVDLGFFNTLTAGWYPMDLPMQNHMFFDLEAFGSRTDPTPVLIAMAMHTYPSSEGCG